MTPAHDAAASIRTDLLICALVILDGRASRDSAASAAADQTRNTLDMQPTKAVPNVQTVAPRAKVIELQGSHDLAGDIQRALPGLSVNF